jgi:hypothetical protein
MSTLTMEQQHALDALFAPNPPVLPRTDARRGPLSAITTWFGLAPDELQVRVTRLLADKAGLERRILDWAETNPLEAAFELLATASLGFYLVEKGANPKIQSYVDAFYYIATCASVGYADVFAVTQPGRAIAALVMTVGPALAARILDRPSA